jgi:hypothetical protein
MKPLLFAAIPIIALSPQAAALAQPYAPPAVAPGQDLRQQEAGLEARIRDGVNRGQIDGSEADRAFQRLNSIRDQERQMRQQNGGALSEVNRGMLQQRLDELSRSIHWMRTNDGAAPPPRGSMGPPPPMAPPARAWDLGQRENWLEQRIQHGVADGSLDRREAWRARRELSRIRADEARMRRWGHGHLSDGARRDLEQRLDRLSAGIRWMRNQGEARPW